MDRTGADAVGAHRRFAIASMIDVIAVTDKESEDARWQQWKAKGRADDARFKRRLKTVLIDGAGILVLCAALWSYFV